MKQKIIINSCVIVMCLALFSCSQDEEVYSCDKEVNVWVKENLTDIQQMNREDWLRLDERVKRAAYVAFKPEQKQEFWIQKFQEVLSLDWNDAERKHLELLYQTALDNPNWFSQNRTEEEYEKYDLFQYKWIEYARDILGWTSEQIASIALTGNKVFNKEGRIQISNTKIRLRSGSEKPDCDCIIGMSTIYCEWILGKKCKPLPCDETILGCGVYWLQTCDGLCTSL
jgi:hypothetical protein